MSAPTEVARDRAVALAWLASRLLVAGVLLIVAAVGTRDDRYPRVSGSWVVDRLSHWDSYHFLRIAEQGYLPPGLPCCDQAYLPGYPLLMDAVRPLAGGSTLGAGLLVSVAASVAAAVLLARLAREQLGDARAGWWAVLLLAVSPAGVFLGVVYSDAPFLAAVLGAWICARHGRWWAAGALAAVACSLRITGLFLLVGLVVLLVVQLRAEGRRLPRPHAVALLLPVATVGAYAAYLHHLGLSWDAYREAQATGWSRETVPPWDGLVVAVQGIADSFGGGATLLGLSRVLDLVMVAGGLVLVGLLARRRQWPELAYVAPSVGVIACSTQWASSPRYALVWFPAYLLLAGAGLRPATRRWVVAGAMVSAVVMLAATAAFALRIWVA